MPHKARTQTKPNPRDTKGTSSSCYFMGSPVATPFQMLKRTPGKGGRDIFNVLNNVPLITTKIAARNSLKTRANKEFGLVRILQPCLANMARLKAWMFLKPIPP